jgi:methionine-gamma-lyase
LINGISVISRAVSLGDIESLIMHPANLKRARKEIRPEGKLAPDVGENLIRLSLGLEDTKYLIDDLSRGLSRV